MTQERTSWTTPSSFVLFSMKRHVWLERANHGRTGRTGAGEGEGEGEGETGESCSTWTPPPCSQCVCDDGANVTNERADWIKHYGSPPVASSSHRTKQSYIQYVRAPYVPRRMWLIVAKWIYIQDLVPRIRRRRETSASSKRSRLSSSVHVKSLTRLPSPPLLRYIVG